MYYFDLMVVVLATGQDIFPVRHVNVRSLNAV